MKIIRLCLWLIGLAVALVLAFYLAHPVMLSGYARLFHLQTATKDADAIICLSGGRTTRVGESLRLWNQGYAKKLFVTAEKAGNKEFSGLELSHLEFAQRVTERMKMDAGWEVIPSLSGGATSTFDEAEDALYYAGEKGWKRIIIVTDEFHTRRAHYAFKKIFAEVSQSLDSEAFFSLEPEFNALVGEYYSQTKLQSLLEKIDKSSFF